MRTVTEIQDLALDLEQNLKETKQLVRVLTATKKALRAANTRTASAQFKAAEDLLRSINANIEANQEVLRHGCCDFLSSEEFFQSAEAEFKKLDLRLMRDGNQWYCFPITIVPDPKNQSIMINGQRHSELSPSVIAYVCLAEKKRMLERGTAQFSETLFRAYSLVNKTEEDGEVVPLHQIFSALVLWPEQKRKYSRLQFAIDLYLLDSSGNTTVNGKTLFFATSTGTRDRSHVFSMRDPFGQEKTYYAIYYRRDPDVSSDERP